MIPVRTGATTDGSTASPLRSLPSDTPHPTAPCGKLSAHLGSSRRTVSWTDAVRFQGSSGPPSDSAQTGAAGAVPQAENLNGGVIQTTESGGAVGACRLLARDRLGKNTRIGVRRRPLGSGRALALVTTHPANLTQSRGRRARPCRRVVLSGNTRPGRKPRRAHTHGVDRGRTPRATNTSCVTGSLLARVGSLEATLTLRALIPSVPLRPSENPLQTPSKDPQETVPSGHMGPVSAEVGRSFGHRLE